MNKWLAALYLISMPERVSVMDVHRALGISYKSSWFVVQRLRKALTGTELKRDDEVQPGALDAPASAASTRTAPEKKQAVPIAAAGDT